MSEEVIERSGLISPWPALALADLLQVPAPDLPEAGLPVGWHWLYLLEHPAQSELGRDGHPVSGIPAPPAAGRRRMWAGGRITTAFPLVLGRSATRRSYVSRSVDKTGRSGLLTFLTVTHEIHQDGRLAIAEEQDILYRDAAAGLSAPAVGPDDLAPLQAGERPLAIDPVLLFRFSALTYNGHRIHYDRDYARDVEGYPGLVVHGPLQAMMMAEAARAAGAGPVGHFEYRLVSPLFENQGFVASVSGVRDDEGHEGGLTAQIRDQWGRVTARGRFAAG